MGTSAQLIFQAIFATAFLSNLHQLPDANWRSTFLVGLPATITGCIFIRLFFISNKRNIESVIEKPSMKTITAIIIGQKKRKI
jgi:hypothetical protein